MASTAPSGEITPKQAAFIVHLLASPSVAAACRLSKITPMCCWRWMQKPAFAEALKTARRKVTDKAIVHLSLAATAAARCLRRNLTCGDAAQEVRAALGILELVRAMVSSEAMEERMAASIAALDAKLSGRQP